MKVLDKSISQLTIPTPFSIGDVHVYLLKGDTLSLVDAGVKTKEAWDALKEQLKEIGYTPSDIEQLILTHHHPDHIGLIEEFPRVQQIVAHKNTDVWLRKDEAYLYHYEQFFKSNFNGWGVPGSYLNALNRFKAPLDFVGKGELTIEIAEGDRLPGHEDWHVIDTKGHAQSHLSFLREKDGAFIGGDHLLHHISPNPLLEPPYEGEQTRPKPMLQYRANLNKCNSLGIKEVFPGHGIIFSDVETLISARLKKQEERAMKVHTFLKEKSQTPFELCQKLFPNQYQEQLSLTMSETIGQLDYLENEGLAAKNVQDGIHYYNAT